MSLLFHAGLYLHCSEWARMQRTKLLIKPDTVLSGVQGLERYCCLPLWLLRCFVQTTSRLNREPLWQFGEDEGRKATF